LKPAWIFHVGFFCFYVTRVELKIICNSRSRKAVAVAVAARSNRPAAEAAPHRLAHIVEVLAGDAPG
jgi:hypothetical protein